jgi:TonB family protein
MNERARAFWRRHATFVMAMLLHIGLLWLALPWLINRSEPLPSDPLDVTVVPPIQPPKLPPKPVRVVPVKRPAETNASASRPQLHRAPRLARIVQPPISLPLPAPIVPNPPMSLPAPSGAPASGSPGNGSGGNGTSSGNGSQEGIDYLIRLKAYIDAHKGRNRHWEPHDADVVLVLDPDGMLTDIHVVSSSGDPSVDDEIMLQLRRMSPFPKPPPVLFSPSKPLLPVADKWIFPRP